MSILLSLELGVVTLFARTHVLKFCRAFSKARAGTGRVAPYTPFLFCKLFSLRLFPTKKKATKKAEKPRGYSRLASANSLPAFSFDNRSAKEKAIKKKTLFFRGRRPHPRAFEKARQNFTKRFVQTPR